MSGWFLLGVLIGLLTGVGMTLEFRPPPHRCRRCNEYADSGVPLIRVDGHYHKDCRP